VKPSAEFLLEVGKEEEVWYRSDGVPKFLWFAGPMNVQIRYVLHNSLRILIVRYTPDFCPKAPSTTVLCGTPAYTPRADDSDHSSLRLPSHGPNTISATSPSMSCSRYFALARLQQTSAV